MKTGLLIAAVLAAMVLSRWLHPAPEERPPEDAERPPEDAERSTPDLSPAVPPLPPAPAPRTRSAPEHVDPLAGYDRDDPAFFSARFCGDGGVDWGTERFANRVALVRAWGPNGDSDEHLALVAWFLERFPDDCVLASYAPDLRAGRNAALLARLRALAAAPDAPAGVLANLGGWCAVACRSESLVAYQRLQEREPDEPKWLDREAHLHLLDADGLALTDPRLQASAALATEALAEALELVDGFDEPLLTTGMRAAGLAGDAAHAEAWAEQLFAKASTPASEHLRWAAHEGLGFLALHQGDAEGAIAELLQMSTLTPGPVETSFGPSLRLANEVLRRGHRAPVIQYLERVGAFWRPDGVADLVARLRAGETPTLDRFDVGG